MRQRELLTFLLSFSLLIFGCGGDDTPKTSEPEFTGNEAAFELLEADGSGISGTVTFKEYDNQTTRIVIAMTGTTSGNDHPVHIHMNTAAEGGGILIDLTNVEGSTGMSETVVTSTNDGTPITYSELIAFDGYINVHSSATNLATLVAQGDIGENVLTGESESYELFGIADPTVSGEAVFMERASGETLIVVTLTDDESGESHPSHIHMNSAAEGGGIAIDLSDVSGGSARTSVSALNDGTPITYSELIAFDGYINVHLSATNLGTLVAQGDIGENALTGESESYGLFGIADPTVSGEAVFMERASGETLIVVTLTGDESGESHPSHIHMNSAAEGGGIAIDLSDVSGGSARTSVSALNDGTPITYSELIAFDGYINVHLSATNLGTLVAQGDIGSNVN